MDAREKKSKLKKKKAHAFSTPQRTRNINLGKKEVKGRETKRKEAGGKGNKENSYKNAVEKTVPLPRPTPAT